MQPQFHWQFKFFVVLSVLLTLSFGAYMVYASTVYENNPRWEGNVSVQNLSVSKNGNTATTGSDHYFDAYNKTLNPITFDWEFKHAVLKNGVLIAEDTGLGNITVGGHQWKNQAGLDNHRSVTVTKGANENWNAYVLSTYTALREPGGAQPQDNHNLPF